MGFGEELMEVGSISSLQPVGCRACSPREPSPAQAGGSGRLWKLRALGAAGAVRAELARQGRGDTSLLSPAFTAPLLSDKIPWEMHPAMGTSFLHLWAGIQEADMCEYCLTVLIPTIQICWRFHLKFKKIQPHKPQKTHLW